jgi:hypothetical protein
MRESLRGSKSMGDMSFLEVEGGCARGEEAVASLEKDTLPMFW